MWTFSAKGSSFDCTPLIHGETVYVADSDGGIYALDLDSGATKWKFASGSSFEASPVIKSGHLYIGDMDGRVYCLDILSGEELWTFDTQGPISASAACYRNRILVSSHDASLYCLESRTGSVIWRFKAADEIHASATVVDGFALVIGSCSSIMHVVNVNNGEQFRDIRLPGETVAGMATKDAHVFTATMHGDALCIDWEEGIQVWSKQLSGKVAAQVRGGPSTIGGKLLIGSSDQYVRALDPSTGDILWKFRAKGAIESSVSVRDARVFFATTRGIIYALDSQNGEELWQHEIGGYQRSGPALAEDWLVVASGDGTVHSFRGLNGI